MHDSNWRPLLICILRPTYSSSIVTVVYKSCYKWQFHSTHSQYFESASEIWVFPCFLSPTNFMINILDAVEVDGKIRSLHKQSTMIDIMHKHTWVSPYIHNIHINIFHFHNFRFSLSFGVWIILSVILSLSLSLLLSLLHYTHGLYVCTLTTLKDK